MVFLALPAELCILIAAPMIQCIGNKYENSENSERGYIKHVLAGWILFILGVSLVYHHVNYRVSRSAYSELDSHHYHAIIYTSACARLVPCSTQHTKAWKVEYPLAVT